MFRPTEAGQMSTPLRLQVPLTTVSFGVGVKSYVDVEGVIMANFKTYGGTEKVSNNVLIIEDTATVVCWYRPDIKSGCRVVRLQDGNDDKGNPNAVFEIIGEPENIEMRNQFLKFRVRRVVGGA